MLLEFRLKNYRSFAEETVFSLVASSDKSLAATNTFETGIASVPRVTRAAVIYGPNASGKSNLLRALMMMRAIVLESPSIQPNAQYLVQPFKLRPSLADRPSMFEVTISIRGVRYQYGFEVTPTRITAEWLLVYLSAKPQVWFDRRLNEETGTEEYKFGPAFTGPKKVWQDATRPNALLLSTASQLNSEKLSPLYKWFSENLHVFLNGGLIPDNYSTMRAQEPDWERRMTSFLSAADVGISSIRIQKMEGFQTMFQLNIADGAVADHSTEKGEILRPRFTHKTAAESCEMDFDEESEGTQKLFALSGPLFDVVQNGRILVIDELDRSLHPLLVKHIIQIFQDPEINRSGAQLIFTTHDTSQLDGNLFRRDQVWFTEKQTDQSSSLTPLTEFSPRKGEALERGYLSGRYGAVPVLPSRLIEQADLGER